MSHIAEGELHAWLDGALDELGASRAAEVREHLRGCAACREALVAEESVRARAAEVLALAAPRAAEAPPFEALVERARGRETAPSARRVSRAARVGWAASIVVALGAGWMARELGLHPPAETTLIERDTPARASVESFTPAEEPATAGTAPTVQEVAPEAAVANGDFAAARDAVSSDLSGPAAPPPGFAVGGAGASVGADRLARADVPPPAEPRPEAREEPAQTRTPETATDPQAAAASPAVGVDQVVVGDVRRAQASADPAPPRPTETPAAAAAPPTRVEAERSEAQRAGQRVVTSALSTTGAGGLQQPARDSAVVFGDPAAPRDGVSGIADADEALDLIVPGLEVLHVEWSQVAPGQPSRRVLQRLASGDTLEIRFVRSVPRTTADPLAVLVTSAPLPGWNQVVRSHRDGWLVARAPVPEVELEALVERAGTTR